MVSLYYALLALKEQNRAKGDVYYKLIKYIHILVNLL